MPASKRTSRSSNGSRSSSRSSGSGAWPSWSGAGCSSETVTSRLPPGSPARTRCPGELRATRCASPGRWRRCRRPGERSMPAICRCRRFACSSPHEMPTRKRSSAPRSNSWRRPGSTRCTTSGRLRRIGGKALSENEPQKATTSCGNVGSSTRRSPSSGWYGSTATSIPKRERRFLPRSVPSLMRNRGRADATMCARRLSGGPTRSARSVVSGSTAATDRAWRVSAHT